MKTLVLSQFVEHLHELDRRPNTVTNYAVTLGQFARWFERSAAKEMSVEDVTPLDIREWRRTLIQAEKAPGTVNQKMAGLSVFFTWCVTQGLVAGNPVANIKRLKQAQAAPRWLDRKQTYALLRVVEEQVQVAQVNGKTLKRLLTKRNAAMVALMLHAGLRVSEVCRLRAPDLQISERTGLVVVRMGKGGKRREVPLNVDARQAVQRWLGVTDQGGGVFSRNGKPLHARTVQQHVAVLGRVAGLVAKLTPHQLRHTFGKNLVDAGVSLDKVALMMGHSDVNTTAIYTMPSSADLQAAVELVAWSDKI